LPEKLIPFDIETFLASPIRCVTAATDCVTGEALYYDKNELKYDYLTVLKASSSLPFIAKPVEYKGRTLMDGGLADSIPLDRAARDGFPKQVVILTRPRAYRKKSPRFTFLPPGQGRKYPGLLAALKNRHAVYNQTLDRIEELEKEGRIFVIRPEHDPPAGRVERNIAKIYLTYDQGYAAADAAWGRLMAWLKQ
ncbi:MAG: patatin family protein, partial [Spirochaetales bacterium]|nr:patatin family protein [Spirochaetales bacterium]